MVSLVAALTVFATIDEAAISALTHAATICNPQYECGGVVRAVNGGFEASGLITSKRPFGVDLGEHIQFIIEALKPQAVELGIDKGMGGADDA